jgi:hypothetical protein
MTRRRAETRKMLLPTSEMTYLYCGTCGCRVMESACCVDALTLPLIPWSLWSTEQIEVGLTLKWAKSDGVMTAVEMTLKTGISEDRLLRWGRKLGAPDAALKSPYLYTANALGVMLFLTPRARDAEY